MAKWKGKTRGGLTGYRIFIIVLTYLGLPFAYFLLRFVAFYFVLFNPSSFKSVYYYFRQRLGNGFFQTLINIYRNYYVFGQVILDRVAIMGGFTAKFTYNFDGEDWLREMTMQKTGGLLISAHIGNFEMAGHLLERLNTSVKVVMLDAEHQKIKSYLDGVTRKSFSVIPLTGDHSHLYAIKESFENKELICMHGDRFMPGSKTTACNFLGKDAFFPTGPFYLALKYEVPVSFVFAMKEGKNHYHFYASRPRVYSCPASPQKRDEAVQDILKNYITELENKINLYPMQWFNYYNFWNET